MLKTCFSSLFHSVISPKYKSILPFLTSSSRFILSLSSSIKESWREKLSYTWVCTFIHIYVIASEREKDKKRKRHTFTDQLKFSRDEITFQREKKAPWDWWIFEWLSFDWGTRSKPLVILFSQTRHEGSVILPQYRWFEWSTFKKEFY